MKAKPLPPIDLLRERYRYDHTTGALYRRTRTYNRRTREVQWCDGWLEVTCKHQTGYLVMGVGGGQVKAHRVCYALYHGVDPYPYEIDHINRDRGDNRICNLRAVTRAENNDNKSDANKNCVHTRKSVRITYPDGRGILICDSINTAARILNRNPTRLGVNIRHAPNNQYELYYGCGTWAQPSGITVSYNLT